ncbi:MAG TPA: TetR/AcrR family transcriptional regulator [Acidimicrobiales bacterium]|jgi:AcrR family transcriptional regulator|nr:TetR/AcrR family transcriptional regulator [Acidimicrobiales bacterium]
MELDTTGSVVRPYRGVSASDRIALRRRQLLDAGLELFGTRGISSVGVGDICAEAALTKRYFYESFASIEELAEAVFEEIRTNLVARVAPAIMAGGPGNIRPAVDAYVRAVTEDLRVLRLLAFETSAGPLAGHRDDFATHAVEAWFTLSGQQVEDPDRTRLRAYAFVGASTQIGLAWARGELSLSIEALIDELVELFENLAAGVV